MRAGAGRTAGFRFGQPSCITLGCCSVCAGYWLRVCRHIGLLTAHKPAHSVLFSSFEDKKAYMSRTGPDTDSELSVWLFGTVVTGRP